MITMILMMMMSCEGGCLGCLSRQGSIHVEEGGQRDSLSLGLRPADVTTRKLSCNDNAVEVRMKWGQTLRE